MLGAALGALLAAQGHLSWPQCPLRKFTGVPCPSCGCTRSLLAWCHLDPAAALQFNPLFFFVCIALPLWLAMGRLARRFHWLWPGRLRQRASRWPVWQLLLLLVALNWLYLCLNLPK